jgi:microsomal dipeptidase-like Zn-dependent dipeptidase
MKYIDDMYTVADQSQGQIRIVRTAAELDECFENGNLVAVFKRCGYSDDRLERICNGNFRRVLRQAWRKE